MVVVPAGRALIGASEQETTAESVPPDYASRERPQVIVSIAKSFAVGKFEITRGEYARFIASSGYMPASGCAVWDFPKGKFAEDSGKSQAEIDAITEPEYELTFEATGVLIK